MADKPKYHDRFFIGPGAHRLMVELNAQDVRALWFMAAYIAEHDEVFQAEFELPEEAMACVHEVSDVIFEATEVVATVQMVQEEVDKVRGREARRRAGMN
jgi:hypothetical protein